MPIIIIIYLHLSTSSNDGEDATFTHGAHLSRALTSLSRMQDINCNITRQSLYRRGKNTLNYTYTSAGDGIVLYISVGHRRAKRRKR